jgi:hypothetical protein
VVEAATATSGPDAQEGGQNGDNVAGWTVVGASVWRWPANGSETAACYPGLAFPAPEARDQRVDVDLRPGWTWALVYVAAYAVPAAGWLAYAVLGLLGRKAAATRTLAGFLLHFDRSRVVGEGA